MDKPDQIGWTTERRAKYARLIQVHAPWKSAGVKSVSGKNKVRWNGLQTGRKSSAILAIYKLLFETKKTLKELESC